MSKRMKNIKQRCKLYNQHQIIDRNGKESHAVTVAEVIKNRLYMTHHITDKNGVIISMELLANRDLENGLKELDTVFAYEKHHSEVFKNELED